MAAAGAVVVDAMPSDPGDGGTAEAPAPPPASDGEAGDGADAADQVAEVAAAEAVASAGTVVNEVSAAPPKEKRESGPVKATVTDVDKHGTVTKGNVGARLAMWSNMGILDLGTTFDPVARITSCVLPSIMPLRTRCVSAHGVCHAHVWRMLIGACNPMRCPID